MVFMALHEIRYDIREQLAAECARLPAYTTTYLRMLAAQAHEEAGGVGLKEPPMTWPENGNGRRR